MMKKALTILAVTAFFFGCEQPTKTVVQEVNSVKVGDELSGGFVVTIADATTGYLATRDVDFNNDGDFTDVGDKQGLVYGKFTSNITLTADRQWTLSGGVFIGNDNSGNATLTIEAGTIIKGSSSTTAPGMLVITRGSKINAVGTAAKPIILTSERAVGSRAAGDWGGVIINGNAVINNGDSNGFAEGEGNTGVYGGTINTDNSGTLKYVRIEFAGVLFTADNELNGLALQGVGSGTTLSYIQVHQNADDGIEFFGGAANLDHFVVTGAQDDSLDWTYGWTGKAQFGVVQQYASADKGIEGDNNSKAVTATPLSNPVIANMTVVSNGTEKAAALRAGTSVQMYNMIFTNFSKSLDVLDSKDGDAATTVFKGVVTTEATDGAVTSYVSGTTGNFLATFANLNLDADLTDADYTNDSFVPTAAITGATAQALPGETTPAANYIGAIAPGAADWTAGWTTSAAN